MKDIKIQLADLCHNQWSHWMKYLFSKSIHNTDGSITIPKQLVDRWKRQMNLSYFKLSKDEQDSDKKEADKFLILINKLKL